MRFLKTTGGLTRGRGVTESQRTLWLLSMPASAAMNRSLQEFSDMNYAPMTIIKKFQYQAKTEKAII